MRRFRQKHPSRDAAGYEISRDGVIGPNSTLQQTGTLQQKACFSGEGTRTLDTADMSRMLYHLSYAAVESFAGTIAAGCVFVNQRSRSWRHLGGPRNSLDPSPT